MKFVKVLALVMAIVMMAAAFVGCKSEEEKAAEALVEGLEEMAEGLE